MRLTPALPVLSEKRSGNSTLVWALDAAVVCGLVCKSFGADHDPATYIVLSFCETSLTDAFANSKILPLGGCYRKQQAFACFQSAVGLLGLFRQLSDGAALAEETASEEWSLSVQHDEYMYTRCIQTKY